MARAGLLHVTVIAATLLRDSGGSDSEPADTYASVGCGKQNFTTNTVKNHRTKPAWNESHTFKFEERNELESQHILIEIFAERPKLDELLGLAKIPLHKVIAVGDEISTHSLNRPDEEYIGHEQYSGHVKVALRWDSAQPQMAQAYPQTYTPAARYNPNASPATGPALSRQTSKSGEQLPTRSSGKEMHHQEDYYGPGQEKKVHHRSSSYPSRSYSFRSSAPSPSQSPWKDPPASDVSDSPAQHPSNINLPAANPSGGPSTRHSSYGGSQDYDNGRASTSQAPSAGPHVPYVPHEASRALKGTLVNGHLAYQKPAESSPANLDPKMQDEAAKMKLSKSKQAEMAKLAELSRLTELAKTQATGLAKAGQQPSPRPKQIVPSHQQQSQAFTKPKNTDGLQPPSQVSSGHKGDGTHIMRADHAPQEAQKEGLQPPKQLTNVPHRQEVKVESQQLTVVPTMLDIVQAQPHKLQKDEKPQQLYTSYQRPADVFYEKAIQKAEKPEKKKGSPFQQTLKILRKASKVFRT